MPTRRRLRPRQTERHTRQILHALLDLYQLLRTPQPIDTLLQTILDTAVGQVPGAQRGSLMVLGPGGLSYRAVVGYDLEALRPVVFPVAPLHDLLGESQVRQVEDLIAWDEQHLTPEMNRILRAYGGIGEIRRTLISKIFVDERFYGVITLDNLLSQRPFPPDAERLARFFAGQAGALLEQALLIDRLRQANTQLIEAEKLASLGRFIASIAHEINNPLTAVIGYADFLAEASLHAEDAAMLAQLRVGAERVRTIVRNLQLFARQQRSGPGPVSLNMLVDQALTLKRGELALDQIDVSVTLDPDLPFTWGDGGQLSQVLLNLLANAQYALRERPAPRELTVTTALLAGERGTLLQLRVGDNGAGIPLEVLGRIFEPFFTTKPAGQGTGLGLSICSGITSAHGGTIAVESQPGAGTVFTVALPLRTLPPELREQPDAQPAERPTGLSVLLVDDDPVVADVVLRALGPTNRVRCASDGAEGARLARDGQFDLVLSDLRMPGVGGLAFYELLLTERPDLARKLLFISGDTSSRATRDGLRAAGRPLLAKPFRPEELYAAIAAMRA